MDSTDCNGFSSIEQYEAGVVGPRTSLSDPPFSPHRLCGEISSAAFVPFIKLQVPGSKADIKTQKEEKA